MCSRVFSAGGGTTVKMAQLLGDRVLPESVVSARRRVRSRVSDLREPLRSRRESLVPGPDIIGMIEENVSQMRTRFVRRDNLLDRIRSRRGGDGQGTGEDSGSQGQSGSASANADSMV